MGRTPSTVHIDQLLDERLEHRTRARVRARQSPPRLRIVDRAAPALLGGGAIRVEAQVVGSEETLTE
jgi:hypothetical protein